MASDSATRLLDSGWTFAQIPVSALLDPNLSDGAFRQMVYLSWRRNQDGDTWPSVETIAEDMGKSADTVSRRTADLEQTGYVIVGREQGQSNHYVLQAKALVTSRKVAEAEPETTRKNAGTNGGDHPQKCGPTTRKNAALTIYNNDMHLEEIESARATPAHAPDPPDDPPAKAAPKPEPKPKPKSQDAPLPMLRVLTEVCRIEFSAQTGSVKGQIRAAAKALASHYDETTIRRLYGPAGLWYRVWPGSSEGRPPRIDEVRKGIGALLAQEQNGGGKNGRSYAEPNMSYYTSAEAKAMNEVAFRAFGLIPAAGGET